MSLADRAWIDGALRNWVVAEREILLLKPAPIPTVIVADGTCAYSGNRGVLPLKWRGVPHQGTITLPDGGKAPLGVMSFAGSVTPTGEPFFIMSLPSVWRSGGVTSELGLERLMDGVLLHEMMHTRQFGHVAARMASLEATRAFGDALSDDSVQLRFAKNPEYTAAYQAETGLFYEAVLESDETVALRLTHQGLSMMAERRRRWLSGPDAAWGDADRLFLGMEGMGQWLIYRWNERARPNAMPTAAALDAVRRNRKWWSQDEGLAVVLLLDRFNPTWRSGEAAADPSRLQSLLETAVTEP